MVTEDGIITPVFIHWFLRAEGFGVDRFMVQVTQRVQNPDPILARLPTFMRPCTGPWALITVWNFMINRVAPSEFVTANHFP